jgi:glycosyltransferase involved in cell wall biosynthesis
VLLLCHRRVDLSIVVPVYNEQDSLARLIEEIHAALRPTDRSYEIVLIDDGSTDLSLELLKQLASTDPTLVVVQFRRNFGQTAAMQAGFDHAQGQVVVTMDADLQNDPRDIPLMLERLEQGFDLVAGWRKDRRDRFLSRRLPSILANRLISWTTKVKLHDYGCTLKVMHSDVTKEIRLYGEMHRFIPAIASWMGVKIAEVEVNHRARRFGASKYGIGRTIRVILDLFTVRFIQSYLRRPMQVFGLAGLFCFMAGLLLSAWLAFMRLVYGHPLADRPLLLLGVLLMVVGIQLLSLGLVADIIARTYFESQKKPAYYVRMVLRGRPRTTSDSVAAALEMERDARAH